MARLTGDIPGQRRLKIGMVGGGQGAYFASYHRAAMRLCNRFDIVAGAFSSDPDKCREAGAAFNLDEERIYLSFADMAAAESRRPDPIEAVVIVTPNHLHFEPCRLFLQAGIPVICDKPLVNSADEAYALASIADRHNTFFALTYTYQGYPMVRDARSRIQAGELGDVRFMYVEYLLEWLAPGVEGLSKSLAWRGDPEMAGPTGALGDVGTHAFNMLEFLSGRRCTNLNAKLSTVVPGWGLDDTCVVQLEFEDGIDGLLWASFAAPGHRNGLRFKIVGSQASIEWSQESPETLLFTPIDGADRIHRRGQSDNAAQTLACTSLPPGNTEGYLEALAVLYADFAEALDAGAEWRTATRVPLPDIHEGVRGVVLSQACVESSQRRAWVPFPER
ncbi:Gfo/Idh/MocA family oxidoreductase [Pseudomonas sp. 14P_8.1_Bac3]|uniref:Gfo/Idh/MocA family protein n=1 Tax=Pseudomonas sp. 14P_8.1_Bac3 TaxID=2971621 RepID=UPI0021CA40ED|nr:Gfo/Idh/MocA family oxidoreductase [Pseudomonas sp. 14P_8.1_Bac3]MCU1759798.1 Gfo/Idh/MocA family oxidoreductase [Pseudomonas sp. 14P_8.1_Bac3]